ncbi:MAG: hypothetical protein NZ781_12775 [Armatimonadetes bacterium]|nr:hypothetical protein [Armatimonadota bacterium]
MLQTNLQYHGLPMMEVCDFCPILFSFRFLLGCAFDMPNFFSTLNGNTNGLPIFPPGNRKTKEFPFSWLKANSEFLVTFGQRAVHF